MNNLHPPFIFISLSLINVKEMKKGLILDYERQLAKKKKKEQENEE